MTMLKYTFLYLNALMLLMLCACSPKEQSIRLAEDVPVVLKRNQTLDSFSACIKEHYRLPALAIGIIDCDGSVQTTVKGNNKALGGLPLTRESKFQIASCTKSLTALLVAVFIENEQLSWNTSVSDLFPEIAIHPLNKGITVIELLSHQSGLRQFWTDEEIFEIDSLIPDLKGDLSKQRETFTAWNLSRNPAFNKGEYHYSNCGYVVVASMLEKITSKSYEALVKEYLLAPLQLNSAEFGYACLKNHKEPQRHILRDSNGSGITLGNKERIPPELFNPCGFLSLSVEDFAKYLKFNIKIMTEDSGPVSKNTFSMLLKNYHTLPNGVGVGLGWQIIEINGIITFGHTGSDQSMRSAMAINPRNKKGVVFLTNIGDRRSEQALVNVIHELIH